MHLLDTDTLTHLHAGHPGVIEHLRDLDDPDVGITIVTRIEILRGRFESVMKASDGEQLLKAQMWLQRSEQLLSGLLILPFDERSATEFDRLREIKRLRKIGRADLLIASITLSRRAVLVTRNVQHFQQIPDLRVINWVD